VNFTYHSTVSDSLLIFALVDGIERAVENLLSNANKFTSDGGSVSLSVSAVRVTDRITVMIEVADDGKGMTVDDASHIWDDNYKGQIDSIGSGLGLPSINAFASSEGGTVWARPNVTGGSTVGFSISCMGVDEGTVEESNRGIRRSVSESEIHMASLVNQTRREMSMTMCEDYGSSHLIEYSNDFEHHGDHEDPQGPWDPKEVTFSNDMKGQPDEPNECLDQYPYNVLLVEDDPLQMRINVRKLKSKAVKGTINIYMATEGNQGLQKLRNLKFDALVTDMNMPVMDGVTMIRIAKEEGVLPPITKLLSAQTFPTKYFESLGIIGSMVYDKTDTNVDAFKDMLFELQAKTLELYEISIL